MKIQIIILCGGEGTRIKHITKEVPKCMYPVGGGPFLFYTLRHYAKYSQLIDSFIFCCSDKQTEMQDAMMDFFKRDGAFEGTVLEQIEAGEELIVDDFFYEGLPIYWATEPRPFGTLAAMVSALPFIRTEYVLVMNGDTYCPVELDKLLAKDYKKTLITALFHDNIHTGVWIVKSSLLATLGNDSQLLNQNEKREVLLGGWESGEVNFMSGPPFIDMGTPEGLKQAKKELRR